MKLKAELLFLPLLSVAMGKSSCLQPATHPAPHSHRLIHGSCEAREELRQLERTNAMIGIYGWEWLPLPLPLALALPM